MQGREREIATLSVQRPQPHTTNLRGKEEKGKIVEDKKVEQLGQQKGIGPGLETRQSYTIEYEVNQSIPERY